LYSEDRYPERDDIQKGIVLAKERYSERGGIREGAGISEGEVF